MLKSRKIRDQKGAAITGLVIALMFFILMAGLFCFDASRVQMAQRELMATCDAAALAGTAMLTSYDVSNDLGPNPPAGQKLLDAQNNAGAYAYNMFLMGNILGRNVRDTTALESTIADLATTSDGQCKVCVGLVNPQDNFNVVPPVLGQNQNGTAIGVFAGYGYHPVFISYFGVGNVGIRGSSVGGLPMVDAVLVLDLSGSMDDLTPITIVKRYWDAHRGVAFGEPEAIDGYPSSGPQPDTSGWRDDNSATMATAINALMGNIPAGDPEEYTAANLTTANFRSVPGDYSKVGDPAVSEQNGTPNSNPNSALNGLADFDEFSGHGCVTYLEAPHPNTNQSLIEYIGLNTATYLTGTSLNVLPPQNLTFAEKGTLLPAGQTLVFKPFLRHSPTGEAFNSYEFDYDSPPGNCPCVKQVGGSWQPVTGGGIGWAWGNVPASTAYGRCSPYHNYVFDHLHYPYRPVTGVTGVCANNNHGYIFTDLVVNFGKPKSGNPLAEADLQKPTQPAWGPNVFEAVDYEFSHDATIEEDDQIRSQRYVFPNIAVLVEAARGNLDLPGNTGSGNFTNTGLQRGYDLRGGEPTHRKYYAASSTGMNSDSGLISPKAGYQRAYQRLAMWFSQPVATTLDSCDQAFFQRIAALTDCRFGLVGFSDSWGISGNPTNSQASCTTGIPTETNYLSSTGPSCNSYYLDVNYSIPIYNNGTGTRVWDGRRGPGDSFCSVRHNNNSDQSNGGGTGMGFRIPRFPLSTANNKAECLHTAQKGHATAVHAWSAPENGDGLYNGRPLNGTMCAEALETARLEFKNAPYDGTIRPGSKRAIIFFTDGVPVPADQADPSGATADACKDDGVAIFAIGLNMLGDADLTTAQTTFLGNDPTPGSGGLSGRARNGGRFFMCNSVTQVQQAFSSIARRLTQSQK